ncbi:hypothetical protein [Streptomyces sp. NPDC058612]|uniref:hypothetical protein n=1 Tax=Streptomyces sp. NPDC058612 TaxID=3346555 RepID=UPI0036481091
MSLVSIVFTVCALGAFVLGVLAVKPAVRDRAAAALLDGHGHPVHRDSGAHDCPACPPPSKEPRQ